MARALALSATLTHIMDTLGMSRQQLAGAVGASHKTVARWLADETYPQHGSRVKLAELEALTERLQESFVSSDDIADWIRRPNVYPGKLRPIDALSCGRIDRVDAALETILSGIFI